MNTIAVDKAAEIKRGAAAATIAWAAIPLDP